MTRRRKGKVEYFEIDAALPIVGELVDCHAVAANRWRGTDVDGVVLDIYGEAMPKYLVVSLGRLCRGPDGATVSDGFIRVCPRDKIELRGWYGVSRHANPQSN